METRPMENFISVPYAFSNLGYFKISLQKLCFRVVFLKVYLLKRSALNLLRVTVSFDACILAFD